MSNTLNELYTSFRKEFGHFQSRLNGSAEFLSKRQSLIEDGLRGFENGDYFETYRMVNDRSAELGHVTSGDPIPSLILARCIDEAFRQGIDSLVPEKARFAITQVLESDRSGAYGWGSVNLAFMLDELEDAKPGQPSQEFARLYDTTRYLRQYMLFRKIGGLLADQSPISLFLAEWREEGHERYNDYSNVHPFVVALCPPHHIWQSFVFDGDVCDLQADGLLKRTPTENCDWTKIAHSQKPFPFLHILGKTE